jgi:hypothetical protein
MLHGGFATVRGRSELERARLALRGASDVERGSNGGAVAAVRAEPSSGELCMAGEGGKSGRFGFTLAKTEA